MTRFSLRDRIRTLDPERDHQRIVYLSTCYEFPFDTTRSLEFALFRSYCVPSISGLLDRTGEFGKRPQLRYDDTDLIVSELMEHGYDSDRGTRALRRLNRLHGLYDIANDDFLYVLSTFVYEPIRWNARFGWRLMTVQEREAQYWFWRAVGERMNIRDIPPSYQAFETFNRAYERENYTQCATNRKIGDATVELFASWFPGVVAPLVRKSIYALLDDPVIEAFDFPRPSKFMRALVPACVRLRGVVVRGLPPRRRPRLRTETRRKSRPGGYVIEELGPPGVAPA